MFGLMAKRPIPDERVRGWAEPGLRDPRVRRDVRAYATSRFDGAELIAHTKALRHFGGDVLVLWSDNRVMPLTHGDRLVELIPHARLRVIRSYRLSSTSTRSQGRRRHPRKVGVRHVARVPSRLRDRPRLLLVAARERDLVASLGKERGEDGAPGPASNDDDFHRALRRR
jgi:hypothetical protein